MVFDERTTVSAKDLMALYDLTQPRISQLVKSGVVVKKGHGKYLLLETNRRWTKYIKGGVTEFDDKGRPAQPDQPQKSASQITKLDEEIRKLKRENDVAERLLIPKVEIQTDMVRCIKTLSDIVMNLKLKIKRLQPELPNRVEDAIEKEAARAMTAICRLDDEYK